MYNSSFQFWPFLKPINIMTKNIWLWQNFLICINTYLFFLMKIKISKNIFKMFGKIWINTIAIEWLQFEVLNKVEWNPLHLMLMKNIPIKLLCVIIRTNPKFPIVCKKWEFTLEGRTIKKYMIMNTFIIKKCFNFLIKKNHKIILETIFWNLKSFKNNPNWMKNNW